MTPFEVPDVIQLNPTLVNENMNKSIVNYNRIESFFTSDTPWVLILFTCKPMKQQERKIPAGTRKLTPNTQHAIGFPSSRILRRFMTKPAII